MQQLLGNAESWVGVHHRTFSIGMRTLASIATDPVTLIPSTSTHAGANATSPSRHGGGGAVTALIAAQMTDEEKQAQEKEREAEAEWTEQAAKERASPEYAQAGA